MGAASRIDRESCFHAGVEHEIARPSAIESCRVIVDPEPGPPGGVLLVLSKREQRQAQDALRLVKSMRHAMSPQAARHLAQLLQLAADRAEADRG